MFLTLLSTKKAYDISLLGRYYLNNRGDGQKNPLNPGVCYTVAGIIAVL